MKPTALADSAVSRRAFLSRSASIVTVAGLSPWASLAMDPPVKNITVQQVIELILREGNLTRLKETVDTLKSGRMDQVVTGLITTMFPTVAVIEEAARQKANFIVAHEPTFYNHLDKTDWVENNSVVKQKQALLARHGITVWRFHDYIHQLIPDAISFGVAKKAGWSPYYKTGQSVHSIPTLSLGQLVQHLKTSLGIDHVRVIGDASQSCTRIALLPGAWGGPRQVSVAEEKKPDVLIVGEVAEWETAEYIRDARLLGRNISLIVLGHSVSEEPGMEYFAEWLQPRLPDIQIAHVASNNPFRWM